MAPKLDTSIDVVEPPRPGAYKAEEWEDVPAKAEAAGQWEDVAPTEDPGAVKTFLTRLFPDSVVDSHAAMNEAFGVGPHDAAAKFHAMAAEGEKQHPWAAMAGDVAPTLAAGPLAPAVAVAQAAGDPNKIHTPQDALAASGRGLAGGAFMGLASKFPLLLGGAMAGTGAVTGDPKLLVGGGALALGGAAGHLGNSGKGAAAEAEDGVLQSLIKKAMPAERKAVNARNAAGAREVKAYGDLLGGATEPLSASPEAARAEAEAAQIKAAHQAAVKETASQNAQTAREAEARARLLKTSTSPITPPSSSVPTPEDLHASAVGKLGAEVAEGARAAEQQGRLGFPLPEDASAGLKNIMPDLESKYVGHLSKFAGGKEARLQELIKALSEENASVGASTPRGNGNIGPAPGYFPNPELLPTSGALKPNPAADFTPAQPPTPEAVAAKLGLTIPKPQTAPLPGTIGPAPGYFPNPELLPTTSTLKPNPLAGFTPEPPPTPEGVGAKLTAAGAPAAEIARMRGEKGVVSRLAGNVLEAGGLSGAAKLGNLSGLVKDPVLAKTIVEPVSKALALAPKLAARIAPFLANTAGPALIAKIKFLQRSDPEFAQALQAQQAGGANGGRTEIP